MWNRLTTENVQDVFAIATVVCTLVFLSVVIPA